MENTKLLKAMSLLASLAILLNIGFCETNLQISSSNTDMNPGQTGYIILNIENSGTASAYNVEVALTELDEGLDSEQLCKQCTYYSSYRDVCFVYKENCFITVGTIFSGETKVVNIPINILDNASTKIYSAEYKVRLSNDAQVSADYSNYNYISGVHIMEITQGTSDFELFSKSITESDTISAKFSLANVGLTDAYSVSISLLENDNYIIESGEAYLGDFESGNYGSVTIEITPLMGFDGSLDFEVSYTNSFGERKSVELTKKIQLSSDSSASYVQASNASRPLMNDSMRPSGFEGGMPGMFNQSQSSINWTGIIIGIGVIIAAITCTVIVISKRKKGKEKK
jgi:uncharacterized membrane protein